MKRLAITGVLVAMVGICSSALATGALSGTYKTKVHSTAFGGVLNGTWTIKFKGGGYTVTDNGKVVVRGKDSFKGSKITLKDKSGQDACPGTTGKYKYALNGKKLKFTKISDPGSCAKGRTLVLTSGKFTKVG